MDKRVLDILCCPVSRQPLTPLTSRELDALNRAVASGSVKRADGGAQGEPLKAGLLTRDRKLAYRLDDGIPVLLADESISTNQVTDFPA
ncbi:MAG: Trm112 family protein [Xanthomonadaceae bacterium]|nr:Trm112 family protein [Xanthomonadaceae bacterium]